MNSITRLPRCLRILTLALLCACAFGGDSLAANPYLSAGDDQPVIAHFTRREWGDWGIEMNIPEKGIALAAEVVTQRVAKMPWGAIYKISFDKIQSKNPQPRTIDPIYLLATDNEILLLNDADMDRTVRTVAAMEKQPRYEKDDPRALTKGSLKTGDELTRTEITVAGDMCTYRWSHNSGHYARMVWKRGVGLVEFAQNRGAAADGFELKRSHTRLNR